MFLRNKLIDKIDVVAQVLVGGKDTATLIDGASFMTRHDLSLFGVLERVNAVF